MDRLDRFRADDDSLLGKSLVPSKNIPKLVISRVYQPKNITGANLIASLQRNKDSHLPVSDSVIPRPSIVPDDDITPIQIQEDDDRDLPTGISPHPPPSPDPPPSPHSPLPPLENPNVNDDGYVNNDNGLIEEGRYFFDKTTKGNKSLQFIFLLVQRMNKLG